MFCSLRWILLFSRCNLVLNLFKEPLKEEYWCEFCDEGTARASLMCEECDYWYCENCLESMHQSKGPFAYHTITKPKMKQKGGKVIAKCEMHDCEHEFYCILCKDAVCQSCLGDLHKNHEVENVLQYNKQMKVSTFCLFFAVLLRKPISCA